MIYLAEYFGTFALLFSYENKFSALKDYKNI